MPLLSRRALVLALLGLVATEAEAAKRRRATGKAKAKPRPKRPARGEAAAPRRPVAPVAAPPPVGEPLILPRLIERPDAEMPANAVTPGEPLPVLRLPESATRAGGSSLAWRPGGGTPTAADARAGRIGLALVGEDPPGLSLPRSWGVDDLPLVLADRSEVWAFRADGLGASAIGETLTVNGGTEAVATVPRGLVRLRVLNAAAQRVFRLYFEDERAFHVIATDAGRLDAPAEVNILRLGPGERAEVLVDLADGYQAELKTTPDLVDVRLPGRSATLADSFTEGLRLLALDPRLDAPAETALPDWLGPLARPAADAATRRRRLVVRPAPVVAPITVATASLPPTRPELVLDGTALAADAGAVFRTGVGTVERWTIETPVRAATIAFAGARFTVLSEGGEAPRPWNRGLKDTLFVEHAAELLVEFPVAGPVGFGAAALDWREAGCWATGEVGP